MNRRRGARSLFKKPDLGLLLASIKRLRLPPLSRKNRKKVKLFARTEDAGAPLDGGHGQPFGPSAGVLGDAGAPDTNTDTNTPAGTRRPMHRALRLALGVLAFLAPIAAAVAAFTVPMLGVRAYEYVMQSGYFHVREVLVEHVTQPGRSAALPHLAQEELLQIAGIDAGTHVIEADVDAMTQRLIDHPWIRWAAYRSRAARQARRARGRAPTDRAARGQRPVSDRRARGAVRPGAGRLHAGAAGDLGHRERAPERPEREPGDRAAARGGAQHLAHLGRPGLGPPLPRRRAAPAGWRQRGAGARGQDRRCRHRDRARARALPREAVPGRVGARAPALDRKDRRVRAARSRRRRAARCRRDRRRARGRQDRSGPRERGYGRSQARAGRHPRRRRTYPSCARATVRPGRPPQRKPANIPESNEPDADPEEGAEAAPVSGGRPADDDGQE